MARDYTKCLLVTANVGSIFEDPEHMMQLWLKEFLSNVAEKCPDFLAIHCQEVGGKNYEDSMQHVNNFVKCLLASETMQKYDKVRVFLDEDFTVIDKFTALGSLYFIHQSVQDVQIYDFKEKEFKAVKGQEILSGNIEHVTIQEKAKFPQEFFPNHRWSRKGFIRTRWNLYNTVFDLVNIHLFHDASNIVAMEKSPSEYSEFRKDALQYTLDRFENDQFGRFPYFMFGDFNFRLDTHHIVQSLTEKLQEHKCSNRGKKEEISKITYSEGDPDKVILSVEKKGFDHKKHGDIFFNCSDWLRGFDAEPGVFSDKLLEYPVTYPPSYPFSEEVDDGTSYMKTRCPSWCDRILYNQQAKNIILRDGSEPEYNMIGRNTCMGDHKPIFLNIRLRRALTGAAVAPLSSPLSEELAGSKQIRITEIETTKYIHVRQNGASVRVFRETSV